MNTVFILLGVLSTAFIAQSCSEVTRDSRFSQADDPQKPPKATLGLQQDSPNRAENPFCPRAGTVSILCPKPETFKCSLTKLGEIHGTDHGWASNPRYSCFREIRLSFEAVNRSEQCLYGAYDPRNSECLNALPDYGEIVARESNRSMEDCEAKLKSGSGIKNYQKSLFDSYIDAVCTMKKEEAYSDDSWVKRIECCPQPVQPVFDPGSLNCNACTADCTVAPCLTPVKKAYELKSRVQRRAEISELRLRAEITLRTWEKNWRQDSGVHSYWGSILRMLDDQALLQRDVIVGSLILGVFKDVFLSETLEKALPELSCLSRLQTSNVIVKDLASSAIGKKAAIRISSDYATTHILGEQPDNEDAYFSGEVMKWFQDRPILNATQDILLTFLGPLGPLLDESNLANVAQWIEIRTNRQGALNFERNLRSQLGWRKRDIGEFRKLLHALSGEERCLVGTDLQTCFANREEVCRKTEVNAFQLTQMARTAMSNLVVSDQSGTSAGGSSPVGVDHGLAD